MVFQGQPSNFKVTRDKKSLILTWIEGFRTVTTVWIHQWIWNGAQSLMQYRRGALLFFEVIRQISRSHGLKNLRFESNLSKITWPVASIKSLRFALLSPVRFLARKAEWSTRRNFTSVLFSGSHQATGPVRLDTAVHRTPQVPRTMPVRASCGPRTRIFNVFHILWGPYGTHKGAARHSYRHVRELRQP